MKKALYYFAILSVAFFLASCSDDDDGVQQTVATFGIIESDVYFEAPGGTGQIKVKHSDDYTAFSTHPEWCHIAKNGDLIVVRVDGHNGLPSRTAVVKVTSQGQTIEVPVTQQGSIVAFPSDVEIERNPAESTIVEITANTGYSVAVPDGYGWVTISHVNDELTITATNNPSALPRRAQIRFTSDTGVVSYMSILQKGGTDQEIYNMLLGTWTASYLDVDRVAQTATVTLAQKAAGNYQEFTVSGLTSDSFTPTLYYRRNGRTFFAARELLGSYIIFPVYSVMVGGGYVTWDSSVIYQAYADTDGTDVELAFGDAASWKYPVEGYVFGLFASFGPSGWLGSLDVFYELTLTKGRP